MKEFGVFILVAIVVFSGVYAVCTVWDFIIETPKQLKRIADAMERMNKYGN